MAWGDNRANQHDVPTLPPGLTYTHIAAGNDFTIALFASGAFNRFGDGCMGSNGIPDLAAPAPPRVGRPLQIDLTPVPTGLAVLIVGFSNTMAAFGTLPFDLSAFGMPRCDLRVRPDLLVPFTSPPARITLPIPDDPALAGFVFYQQAVLFDAPANPIGLVMSQAYTAIVGS